MFAELLIAATMLSAQPISYPADDLFENPNSIVIQGRLKALTRTDSPMPVYKGDQVIVSNSCGYDTAILDVHDVLLGKYGGKELAAHLHLGEFCESILQNEVKDYVLYLAWTGEVWEVSNELSSPILRARDRKMWIVEPPLLEFLAAKKFAAPKQVHFRDALLAEIAVGRMERMGYVQEKGTTYSQWVAELRSWKPTHGWRNNPMYFAHGIELEVYRRVLASNYASQRTTLKGRR